MFFWSIMNEEREKSGWHGTQNCQKNVIVRRGMTSTNKDDLILVIGVVAIAVVVLWCVLNGMKLMPY